MSNTRQAHLGGSFAPPLSDEKLATYRQMAAALGDSPVKDALLTLLKCCGVWWELPEPDGAARVPHPVRGTIVPLQDDHAKALWECIPWGHELEAMAGVLETIDPVAQRDLRNAAFHLLWHVKELDLDREPLTSDRL